MTKRNYVFPLVATAALCAFFVMRPVTAGVWDKRTDVRFHQPVELPGRVVLPSGEYVMKLLDSQSQRHIVQVFNKDQDRVYATIHAIPTERPEPADRTIINFHETPATQPLFIRNWFYPGDTVGQEFVYTKDRARYISSLSGSPVTSEDKGLMERPTQEAAAMNQQEPARGPEVAQSIPPAEDIPAKEPELAQAQPLPQDLDEPEEAAEEPETPQGSSPTTAQVSPELPETAGYGPSFGLGGALLLTVAALVKKGRAGRRS